MPIEQQHELFDLYCLRLRSNDNIPVEHLSHLIGLLGGRKSQSTRSDLFDELERVGESNQGRFVELAMGLDGQYINNRGFQVTWFPFAQEIEVGAALKEQIEEMFGLHPDAFLPQYDTTSRNPYVARVFKGSISALKIQYVIPKFGATRKTPAGVKEAAPTISEPRAVIRPNGIEVRASGSLSDLVAADIHSTLCHLGYFPGDLQDPVSVLRRATFWRIVERLNARIIEYHGLDNNRDSKTVARGAWEDAVEIGRRDLRALAQTNQAVANHLALDFMAANIEFDFQHADGFLEKNLGIELKRGYIRISSRTSEAALEHFWRAFMDAIHIR